MLKQIFAIMIKDLKILLNDKGGLVSLFLMPVMFILVMSSAMENSYEVSDDKPTELLVVNLDEGALAADAISQLDEVEGIAMIEIIDDVPLTFEMADNLIADGDYNIAIIFPADFSDRVLEAAVVDGAEGAVVTFITDPATGEQFLAPIRGAVVGFIQQSAAYAQMPLQLEAGFEQLAEAMPADQAPFVTQIGEAFLNQMKIESGSDTESGFGIKFEQVAPSDYEVTEFPTSVEQNVPGYTIFGVFFIVQVLAGSILQEKEEGTFRRLLVAPLPRAALLIGKLLPYYIVNLIQVTSMFAIGVFIFDMNLGHEPLALILVTLATAAAATGLGLLVAAVGKTREQIGGISTLLVLTLAAIGGMMFPTFAMPEFMQSLSKISPHSWALAGYQDVIVRGLGLSAVLNEVGVLMIFSSVFFLFALWRFRFQE